MASLNARVYQQEITIGTYIKTNVMASYVFDSVDWFYTHLGVPWTRCTAGTIVLKDKDTLITARGEAKYVNDLEIDSALLYNKKDPG